MYQPGVRLYDHKKVELDQDLRMTSNAADVDERIQVNEMLDVLERRTKCSF